MVGSMTYGFGGAENFCGVYVFEHGAGSVEGYPPHPRRRLPPAPPPPPLPGSPAPVLQMAQGAGAVAPGVSWLNR